jgi:hypothetical protein
MRLAWWLDGPWQQHHQQQQQQLSGHGSHLTITK